jgi:hypothetical protein
MSFELQVISEEVHRTYKSTHRCGWESWILTVFAPRDSPFLRCSECSRRLKIFNFEMRGQKYV